MNDVLICFVRNDGAPRLSMMGMIVGSLSNVVLDYVFIFPFGMGIFGAVLATGLAPVISICVMSAHFIKKRKSVSFSEGQAVPRRVGQYPVPGRAVPGDGGGLGSGYYRIQWNSAEPEGKRWRSGLWRNREPVPGGGGLFLPEWPGNAASGQRRLRGGAGKKTAYSEIAR